VGASWEGFAIEQILGLFRPAQPGFWSNHSGPELDLVFLHRGRRLGFEIKFTEAPRVTPSMRHARQTLKLDHLWVVYPGADPWPMDEGITALPLSRLPDALT
jgi:hypothetical protein